MRMIACVSMLAVSTASADIIWDYGPSKGTHSGNWQNFTEFQNFAEDVVFNEDATVDGVDMFTTFTGVAGGSYRIKILFGDGAGNPGAVFMSWDQNVTSITQDFSGNVMQWKHSFDFDPVTLKAGTIYWIGVSGNGWEPGQSSLKNPHPDDGFMAQFSGSNFSFHTSVGDQMFQVRGTLGASSCYADCNGDGSVNIFDFLCFQGLVTTGSPEADCNGDGSVNIFDFLCFQGAVTQGC
jgi:hypothetical protein